MKDPQFNRDQLHLIRTLDLMTLVLTVAVLCTVDSMALRVLALVLLGPVCWRVTARPADPRNYLTVQAGGMTYRPDDAS